MKAAELPIQGDRAQFSELTVLIKSATKELAGIRKDNHASDLEIRRLQVSTRKKLSRIRENLRRYRAKSSNAIICFANSGPTPLSSCLK